MTHWPQNAYVGQKVVCIKDTQFITKGLLKSPLLKGIVYTIDGIWDNGKLISLTEIKCPCSDPNCAQYLITRFRPVQSTDTGIAILKELLINPHKVLEDA